MKIEYLCCIECPIPLDDVAIYAVLGKTEGEKVVATIESLFKRAGEMKASDPKPGQGVQQAKPGVSLEKPAINSKPVTSPLKQTEEKKVPK